MKHTVAYCVLLLVIAVLAWKIYSLNTHRIIANSVIEGFQSTQGGNGVFEVPLMPKTPKKYSRVLTDHPGIYPINLQGKILYWVLDEPFTVRFQSGGLCGIKQQDPTTKLYLLAAQLDNLTGQYVAVCQVSNPLTPANYGYDIWLPNEHSGKSGVPGMAGSGIRTCDGCVIDTNDYPEN